MTCKHCFHMDSIFHDDRIVKTFKICCTCGTVYDTWFIDYGFTDKKELEK